MPTLPRCARFAAALALCLLTTACGNRKVTKANFDKVTEGMSLADVEKILGKGSKETGDGSNVAGQFGVAVMPQATSGGGDVYVWESGDKKITLTFRQDKLAHKQATGF
ncbi:MAG: hypothetical protein U0797_17555 [Gemmataceae bacterium]